MEKGNFDPTIYQIMLDDLHQIKNDLNLDLTEEEIEALARANATIISK